jgi:uncharacterized protein YkuJ
MNRLFALLAALAVLPAYADYTTGQPAAAAAQPAAQPAAAEQPIARPKSTGIVARAQFTNAIQDREPVDKVSNLLNDKNRIYFFSEIKDASNQKVTHRWEHNGKVMSETSFDVGSSRWRVFSSKNLDPSWTGEWKVSVVDEAGSTLGASTFTYENAPAAASQPASSTPAAAQPATAAPQKP